MNIEGAIRDVLRTARRQVDDTKTNPTSLAKSYVAIRLSHDSIKDALDELGKLVEVLKTSMLPQLFEDHDVRNVSVEVEGAAYRVGISQRVVASIKGDLKIKAYDWLREHELGALVTETVNASTLAATAKTMLEDGKELDPDLFTVAVLPTVSMTKVKTI